MGFIFFVMALLPLNGFAVENVNEIGMLKGSFLAMHLAETKTFGELTKVFLFSAEDRRHFENELKKNNLSSTELPLFIYKNSAITFPSSSSEYTVDLRDVGANVLYINKNKIDISQKISFLKALELVQNTVGKPDKKSAWQKLFIPKALALEMPTINFDAAKTVLASVVTYFSNPNHPEQLKLSSSIGSLAENLIETYQNHKKLGGEYPHFECKQDRLFSIKSASKYIHLTYQPDKGYKGSYNIMRAGQTSNKPTCQFEANKSGVIIRIDNLDKNCAQYGANIFQIENRKRESIPYFGEYPLVADACCKTKCAIEVKNGIAAIDKKFFKGTTAAKPESSRARGARR